MTLNELTAGVVVERREGRFFLKLVYFCGEPQIRLVSDEPDLQSLVHRSTILTLDLAVEALIQRYSFYRSSEQRVICSEAGWTDVELQIRLYRPVRCELRGGRLVAPTWEVFDQWEWLHL